jgi:hypothetical protein
MKEESFLLWYSHGKSEYFQELGKITTQKDLLLNDISGESSFRAACQRSMFALSGTRGSIYKLLQERR